MKLTAVLLLCLFGVAICDNWAILVAGSNTWSNYRHQSDVFHAYQILKKNGFAPERIITFAYDDIADNIKNPFKGKVFNKPTNANPGIDVYAGVVIDYKGASVDPAVFLSVLEGNKTAVAGKGSGKVLESTKDDNVFLFFSDHGAPGLIAFPSKYLYAKDLIPSFAKINGKYNKFVFYLEACESGSMFTSLPNNTKIYALSAANPSESSWATYCSPQDIVQGKHIGSCLGDLFSVNFLENTEESDIFSMTLNQQFNIIKQKTTQSHVLQWGDMSFSNDKVSEYLAYKKTFNFKFGIPKISQLRRNDRIESSRVNFDSRTVKMHTLLEVYAREQTAESLMEFTAEVKSMKEYDRIFEKFESFFEKGVFTQKYDAKNINFDCLKESIDTFEGKHGRLSDYGLKYIAHFARACEVDTTESIKEKIHAAIMLQ